ncbi:MAG: SBBP repeat-containing protein [Bacteroidetes bacterium]|nr:SBBP repeat-containing protein [Bacteroidota bacterium]MCA6445425.1 SBBP repeat-containing protein [Bacteroidota bacterium]
MGNLYITGFFEGTADFDPGPGVANLTKVGNGRDFYFAKYDSNGNYIWAKNLGGGNSDVGNSITIDSVGNVHIAGSFFGILDFDPGPGTATLSSGVFVAEYDANGNYMWARSLPSNGFHDALSVKVDALGNTYVTGFYQGTMNFDFGANTYTINGGNQSIFLAKYDKLGNYKWAKSIGIAGYCEGHEICLDENRNIYLTGTHSGTTDFDPGPSTSTITPAGFGDVFFAKYDSLGNYLWAKSIGNNGWQESYTIVTDKNKSIYLSGYYTGAMDFDPSSGAATMSTTASGPDIFLAKYDSIGNYVWAKSIGSNGYDFGNSLFIDQTGDIYLTGNFSQTVDFDPNPTTSFLTSNSASEDVFFAKYSSTVVGLLEEKIDSLSVYPNPANEVLMVKNLSSTTELIAKIYNTTGVLVSEQSIGSVNRTINVKTLPKSFYFLILEKNNRIIYKTKFIKEL